MLRSHLWHIQKTALGYGESCLETEVARTEARKAVNYINLWDVYPCAIGPRFMSLHGIHQPGEGALLRQTTPISRILFKLPFHLFFWNLSPLPKKGIPFLSLKDACRLQPQRKIWSPGIWKGRTKLWYIIVVWIRGSQRNQKYVLGGGVILLELNSCLSSVPRWDAENCGGILGDTIRDLNSLSSV